jgi:hypothetical protein
MNSKPVRTVAIYVFASEEAFATREQIDVYLCMVKNGTADKGMVSLWGFYGTGACHQ